MQIETYPSAKPPGNPDLQVLANCHESLVRARVRFECEIALLAKHHRAPSRGEKKYSEIAALLNAEGSRTWRGRPWTGTYLRRLVRRFNDPVTYDLFWHSNHIEED